MLNIDYNSWNLPRFIYQARYEPTTIELIRNGVHSFVISEEFPEFTLDFLASGFAEGFKGRSIIIGFNGALSAKTIEKGSLPPYFSGIGLSKATGLPLFSVADPTMALDRSITMAWYAGNSYMPNLVEKIAGILDLVIHRLKANAILLGGSAGGFAALNVLSKMNANGVSVVCWNAQTSLSEYQINSVRKYLMAAYGIDRNDEPAFKDRRNFRLLLKNKYAHVPYSLPCVRTYKSTNQIIYLQNFSDKFHTVSHATRWLNEDEYEWLEDSLFLNKRKNIQFFLGNWGEGHISPPLRELIGIIQSINDGAQFESICSLHLSEYKRNANSDRSWLPSLGIMKDSVKWKVDRRESSLSVEVSPKENVGPVENFEYAFYLRSGKDVLDKKLYSSNSDAEFAIQELESRTVVVTVFLKDKFGAIRSVNSPPISI